MTGLHTGPALDLPPSSRAYSAIALRALADTLETMPTPSAGQPHEVVLASHTEHGDETFGRLLWHADGAYWVFVSETIEAPEEDTLEWEPDTGQQWPLGSIVDGA